MIDGAVKTVQKYLFKHCWDSYLVILPTWSLVEDFVDKLFAGEVKGALYPRIYDYESFIDEIIQAVPFKEKLIGEVFKQELLGSILNSAVKNNELRYFMKSSYSNGVVNSLAQAIGEFKQALVTPNDISAAAKHLNSGKLEDVALIYKRYKQIMAGKGYWDHEDRFLKVLDVLENGDLPIFKELDYMYADWFIDTTIVQKRILEIVASRAKKADILLAEYGKTSVDELQKHFLTDDKNYLAEHLFTLSTVKPVKPLVNITVAWGRKGEARQVAALVKDFLQQGNSLEDIAVASRDPAVYLPYLERALSAEGIPLRVDMSEPLKDNQMVKSVLNLFRAVRDRETGFELGILLENPYTGNRSIKDDCFWRWLKQQGRLSVVSWRKAWADVRDKIAAAMPAIAFMEGEALLSGFLDKLEEVKTAGLPGEIVASLRSLLTWLNISGRITALPEGLSFAERVKLAGRDWRALEVLEAVLGQMQAVYDDYQGENYRLDDIISKLESLTGTVVYVVKKGVPGGLRVISASEARGLSFKTVIILGMVEGEFPRRLTSGWVINDRERLAVRRLFFLPASGELYEREKVLFYMGTRTAREELCLLYSPIDSDGQGQLPSLFIGEAERVQETRKKDAACSPVLPDAADAIHNLRDAALYLLAKGAKDEALSVLQENVQETSHLRRLLMVDEQRQGVSYGCWDGYFSSPAVIAEQKQRTKKRVFSISVMEHYAMCPMRYFLGQELKLAPLESEREFEVSPMDWGSAAHAVLAELLPKISAYSSKEELYQAVFGRLELYCEKAGLTGKEYQHSFLWQLEKDNLCRQITEVLRREQQPSSFKPWLQEWDFGSGKNSFVIDTDYGPVAFRGIVDRVDKDDGRMLAIYDYKLGSGRNRRDILRGRALQLPVYMMAAEDQLKQEVSAAAYINIRKGKIEGLLVKEGYKRLIDSSSRVPEMDEQEWQDFRQMVRQSIGKYYKNISEGIFYPRPYDCSYCPFTEICLYDRARLRKKQLLSGGDENEA